jgi:hypothetical protein
LIGALNCDRIANLMQHEIDEHSRGCNPCEADGRRAAPGSYRAHWITALDSMLVAGRNASRFLHSSHRSKTTN